LNTLRSLRSYLYEKLPLGAIGARRDVGVCHNRDVRRSLVGDRVVGRIADCVIPGAPPVSGSAGRSLRSLSTGVALGPLCTRSSRSTSSASVPGISLVAFEALRSCRTYIACVALRSLESLSTVAPVAPAAPAGPGGPTLDTQAFAAGLQDLVGSEQPMSVVTAACMTSAVTVPPLPLDPVTSTQEDATHM
jgi:hypothetical protein